jgi:hypothetical protein
MAPYILNLQKMNLNQIKVVQGIIVQVDLILNIELQLVLMDKEPKVRRKEKVFHIINLERYICMHQEKQKYLSTLKCS